MRRSGSASCMLRPKNSLSSEDLQRLASWVKAGTPPTTVLTVVDNHKQLRLSLGSSSAVVSPQLSSTTTTDTTTTATTSACSPSRQMTSSNCVVDRLYILGELQARANAIRFLCEDAFSFSNSTSRSSTKDHEKMKNDDEDAKLISTHHFPPPLPPSVILYLLWNDNSSAQSFADGTITDCVRRCLQVNGEAAGGRGGASKDDDDDGGGGGGDCKFICDEDTNDMCLRGRHPRQQWYLHHEGGIRRQQQQQQTQQHLTRIYVVVDRISSPLPSASPLREKGNLSSHQSPIVDNVDTILHHRYNCEVTLAKQLARAASTSIFLRERIDGITIGIASDDRATPGLEACMDAVERGAKERRKCAARRQVGCYRGRRRGSGGGDGGRISTWFTTPSSLSAYATETTELNNNNNTDVRDDEVDGNTKTRRNHMLEHIREKSPERSPVAIVAMHPKDLERVPDHHHRHHNQLHQEQPNTATNILQCRVSTEWNGNGGCNSFTDRAMGDWREVWLEHHVHGGGAGAGDENEIINKEYCTRSSSSRRFNSRPKVSRIWRGGSGGGSSDHIGGNFEEEQCNEPISTVMVIVFLVAVVSHVWYTYGDIIHSCLLSVFYVRNI